MRSWFSSVKASLGLCLSPRGRHRKVILDADFRDYREIRSIPWNWLAGPVFCLLWGGGRGTRIWNRELDCPAAIN